jgi:CspA family cold shock protein
VEIVTGSVLQWWAEDGWGVLTSAELDGTVFAHFSMIRDQVGFRGLEAGQQVAFTWRRPGQDGCDYNAVDIYTTESRTPVEAPASPPGAYSSSLTITFDDGHTMTFGGGDHDG